MVEAPGVKMPYVIARDEALLRSVVRKGELEKWERPPQFKMDAPDPYAAVPEANGREEDPGAEPSRNVEQPD
jgi:hypothetical protein